MAALTAPGVEAETPALVTLFEQTYAVPQISRERAITRAVNATGLKLTPTKVEYGLATDTAIPFFNVVKRPAWKVIFDRVGIFGRNEQGVQEKNPNIRSITVLIDANTGALLKAYSPKPPSGTLVEQRSEVVESRIAGAGGLVLKSTSLMPKVPFMQALEGAELVREGLATQAKELVGYFGLMTRSFGPRREITGRPYWIILAGGVNLSFSSGGPMPMTGRVRRAAPVANEAMVIVDAESGTSYLARLDQTHHQQIRQLPGLTRVEGGVRLVRISAESGAVQARAPTRGMVRSERCAGVLCG